MKEAVRGRRLDPELYLNRELSTLEFNRRVLMMALDESVPLLERLRFLTIFSSNLDEFFEVRVAGLQQRQVLGMGLSTPDGLTPQEALEKISERAHQLVELQYSTLNEVILPALAEEGIHLVRRSDWSPAQREWVEEYFDVQALPVLTPVGLDPAHPFPNIQNKTLNFIVTLEGEDDFNRNSGVAVVQVPRCLPRVIALPMEVRSHDYDLVLLSSVIHANIQKLFPGMVVTGCYQFRVTRDSDLEVDEDEIEDLMSALEGELMGRRFGREVRLEVASNCSQAHMLFLQERFELSDADLYRVNGPVNLHRISAILDEVDRPDLRYPPHRPIMPEALKKNPDVFSLLREQDLLLHHPYDSFMPVLNLMQQAARDPQVLAIKQTLYRTGFDSPIVEALEVAARGGKAVTAVVELRARFDEAANIQLATRLQRAGANVVYGIVGYKTHAKALLIVRREGDQLRRYVHLGTGNYHSVTTRLYTDYSLLSADSALGEDLHALFLHLTGIGHISPMRKCLTAPFTLCESLVERIERETEHARAGRPAGIKAKMNSLSEPSVIEALYEASQAGVPVELIVRGICRLKPGVPGVSENIRVRSIIGRFLEHSRIYWFANAGEPELYCGSADWMERNLLRRVELAFPVEQPALRERIHQDSLVMGMEDNCQAWELQQDGVYVRRAPGEQARRASQELLMKGGSASSG